MTLPFIFATQPAGNVPASDLDTNFTFLESQGVQGLTTTGSSNAYVATPADAWLTGYNQYVARALTILPSFTNPGAATLNVSSLGAASIYKNVAGVQTALANGDIKQSIPAILICDGTGFLLANPTSSPVTFTSNSYQNTVSSPAGTTSATAVMMGLAGAITPETTGTVMIVISGTVSNTSTGGAAFQARYGTGAAPANGVASTGAGIGAPIIWSPSTAGADVPFSLTGIASGLVVGTAYWIDMQLQRATAAGTASVSSISVTAYEIK